MYSVTFDGLIHFYLLSITSNNMEGGAVMGNFACLRTRSSCRVCGMGGLPTCIIYIALDIGNGPAACKKFPIQFAYISNLQEHNGPPNLKSPNSH